MRPQSALLRFAAVTLLLTLLPIPYAPHPLPVALAETTQDRKAEADRLFNQGNQQFQISQFGAAIESGQQALQIYREIHDRQNEGKALGNLGIAYSNLGNNAKAIEYTQQHLVIAREIHDRQSEGNALGNLGAAYLDLGNYAKAIEYEQQALAIAREIHDRQSERAALGNLGLAYLDLGNYAKAIEYEQQALAIAREIHDRQGEGAALGNLGNAYEVLGNDAKAIEYYQQFLAIAREIQDRQSEGKALGNLGIAYEALGNDAKAIEYGQQFLAIAREIKDRQAEGQALGSLGIAYSNLGNDAKAIESLRQDLAIAREIKDHQGEGMALNNLGYAFLRASQLPAAAQSLRAALQVWESLRQDLGQNDSFKVSLFEGQSRSYRILQQVFIAQNKPNAALEIAERGRARALVELLSKQVSSSQPSTVSQPQPVPSLSLEQIQQVAKVQKATLVEYSILYEDFQGKKGLEARDSALYIWVIPPHGQITFRSVDLKPLWQQQKTTLAALVRHSRAGIGVLDRATRDNVSPVLTLAERQQLQAQQSRYLKQLHHLLIEPIADRLPTDPTAHVIFMPQASLFLVPFAALQDKSDQYLIQQHTISLAPAIQILALTHQQRQVLKPTTSVLVAGNPTMPQVTVPGVKTLLYLPDLPGAKQEALDVAKTLHTTALLGGQATKHAIVQQMLTARLIHLATHGLLDDFKGLGVPGAIALAPDGTGKTNDGLLTADDLLGMKLNAELVVLSACNTGQGTLTGDGVIGLSRSLIAAGTPSVIVSLWSVPDAPTASLMTDFYHNWQTTHLDKAQALRQAMLTTMQSHPNPLDWAAFTLIGEAQ